jgi:hypothetical protein
MSNKPIIPKFTRKATIRMVIGLFVIAAGYFVLQTLTSRSGDLTIGNFDSAGYMVAIQKREDEAQVVLIKPDGTIQESTNWVKGSYDENPIWDNEGRNIYFVTDRDSKEPHIFRWNPAERVGDAVRRRSLDRSSKSSMSFRVPGGTSETALVVQGGRVIEFNPAKGSSLQVLPPLARDMGGGGAESGSVSAFDQLYEKLGTSFKNAQWGKNKEFIVATMRREQGEILILQPLLPDKDGNAQPPVPVLAGERVDFDVSNEGKVVAVVVKFGLIDTENIPPELIKNGKLVLPFRHGIFTFNPGEAMSPPIAAIPDNQVGFLRPRWDPAGKSFFVNAGPVDGDNQVANRAVLLFSDTAGASPTPILPGVEAQSAEWHPNGNLITFTALDRKTQKNAIFQVNREGKEIKNLTEGKGDFESPRFSPVSK